MALPPYTNMSTKPVQSVTPQPNKFLCCLSLRVGCLILGYLNLMYTLIQTIIAVTMVVYVGIATNGFHLFDSEKDSDGAIEIGVFILICLAVLNVAWLAVNIACVIGIHKKKPGPIRVYSIFVTIRLVLVLTSVIYTVVTTGVAGEIIVVRILDISISAYILLTYYRYIARLELEREARNLPAVVTANKPFSYLEKIPSLTQPMTEKIHTIA